MSDREMGRGAEVMTGGSDVNPNQEDRTMDTGKKLVADSTEECIAPMIGGGMRIGFVDEIHGRGALEVPEFIPSRHELLMLLKCWCRVNVDIGLSWHCTETVGSSDSREKVFAGMRMTRIADALNDAEAVNQAIDEVYAEFAEKCDGLTWRTFVGTATPEEKAQWRAEQDASLRFEA